MSPRKDQYDSPTPTTDATELVMALVIVGGELGEMTAHILTGMYPSPFAMNN
jgi:hypothetical protein